MDDSGRLKTFALPGMLLLLVIAGVLVALSAGGVFSRHEPGFSGPPGPPGPPGLPGRAPFAVQAEESVQGSDSRGLLRLRVGFATPTPIHCALGEILLRTEILARHGFLGEMVPLPKGRDQHEAGSQGLVDAVFTGEFPTVHHLDRLPGLVLVGSPGRIGELALVTHGDLDVRGVGDLRDRRIGVLGGSSSRLLLEEWLGEGGVPAPSPDTLEVFPVPGTEALAALRAGDIAALVIWDPWLTQALGDGDLQVLVRAPIWSALAVHGPHLPEGYRSRYLDAIEDALRYGADHFDEVVDWVSERNGIPRDTISAVLRKNEFMGRGEAPGTEISPAQMARLRACEASAHRNGEVPQGFSLEDRIWREGPPRLPPAMPPTTNPLVRIPGGVFQMGALEGDERAIPCERPRHEVRLASFYLQEHEVTVAEYQQAVLQGVVAAPGCGVSEEAEEWYCNWNRRERLEHPVNGVSWYAAETYCRWLGMRLPTEAEFEYVLANGTRDALHPWGNDRVPPDDAGNYVDEMTEVPIRHWVPVEGRRDGYSGTSPIGTFPADIHGLVDIGGNVWEWTADWFGEDTYSPRLEDNPRGPSSGHEKINRGAGFSSSLEETRISERHHKPPTNDSIFVGFRCARDLEDEPE